MHCWSAANASLSRIRFRGRFITPAQAAPSGPPIFSVGRRLNAPEGVDPYAGGVRGILKGRTRRDVHRNVAEAALFHGKKTGLVAVPPGRAGGERDRNFLVLKEFVELGLHQFRLRDSRGRE